MTDAEAREFVNERLRVLRIEKLVNDLTQLEPLVVATGGNPKAIEIALGLVKHERRPLQHVVDDLYAARGDLFDDLFTRAWALLDEAARRVLQVMTFFQTSASSEALNATADIQDFAFDRAIERLTDLALLDVQQVDLNSRPRYTLHPLVRAYAGARLKEQVDFEHESRNRWIEWYTQLVSQIGYCWNDIGKLDRLDFEQENIYFVIDWVFKSKQYNKVLDLCRGCNYYYHQRGDWDRSSRIYAIRVETARILHDPVEQVCSLAYHLQLKSRQGKVEEARILLNNCLR